MPRLVPSTVRKAIAQIHPNVVGEVGEPERFVYQKKTILRAVVDLIDQIPAELVALPPEAYAAYSVAVSVVREAITTATAPGDNPILGAIPMMAMFPENRTALRVIYEALGDCRDEAASDGTTGLEFIDDEALRESLRRDISSAASGLANHEYKATTVLAGSVVEALLMWALERLGMTEVEKRCTSPLPKGGLDEWHLPGLIRVARACNLIREGTATQANLAKDFRNLIHPGRVVRERAECNQGTAHTALAAVYLVSSDLEAQAFNA